MSFLDQINPGKIWFMKDQNYMEYYIKIIVDITLVISTWQILIYMISKKGKKIIQLKCLFSNEIHKIDKTQ